LCQKSGADGRQAHATFAKLRFLPADDQEATQRQAGAATIKGGWQTTRFSLFTNHFSPAHFSLSHCLPFIYFI